MERIDHREVMGHHMGMKRQRVTSDGTPERADRNPPVRGQGTGVRSGEDEFDHVALRDRERERIDGRYVAGYRGAASRLEELDGWTAEGVWPET